MGAFASWAKCAGIRAVKTAAQAALGVIGATTVMGGVDWVVCGSAALLAAIVSLLTSVAGIPEANGGKSVVAAVKEGDGEAV